MLISLVVPVFNEQETINTFYTRVREDQFLRRHDVEIIFVNDGSQDETAAIIGKLIENDPLVELISFTRNFGKEPALFCGLENCHGDVVIPLDVDLQDPIELIEVMYAKWQEGAKLVLAKRSDRSSDHWLKRLSANWFYKLHNQISPSKIEENVGDFRLLDKKVVEIITHLQEKNLFMKGLLSWPGFNPTIVEYVRPERSAGDSKFNALKLFNLAIEGITSFSITPLKLASYMGFLISLGSLFYGFMIIAKTLIFGIDVPGYASLMALMAFLGGIQLITIGIMGEYIGRIYIEVKGRPRYVIESIRKQKNTQ